MSLAQGNNTPTRPRIEPGSPDPESNALNTRPVRSPTKFVVIHIFRPTCTMLDSFKVHYSCVFFVFVFFTLWLLCVT